MDSGELLCLDTLRVPPRPQRAVEIPAPYRHGSVGRWLTNDETLQGRIWLHQGKALEAAHAGHNVVLATGTASGKTLAFQSVVFHALERRDDAVAIVFYPLKALVRDQLKSWRRVARLAGLDPNSVLVLDGDVQRRERAALLERGRVVLMTPDVCHAWFLEEISNRTHRNFLKRLAVIVIDEAHTLEGVFGTNFAYLFRRLCAARLLTGVRPRIDPLQVVAATATIRDPAEHLELLTGLPFEVIGRGLDGSPYHGGSLVHVWAENPTKVALARLLRPLVLESDNGSFIAFVDSRQGTERITAEVELDELVKSYRSGFEPEDRAEIENSLKRGTLRGVVSTSALELGIDIPHFTLGLTIGVPHSRKAFLQRLGRVGRNAPGVFAVFAEPTAFRRFGDTLADYYGAAVEPSYLYLENRFVQYAHARCMADELEILGQKQKRRIPAGVMFPEGFSEVLDFAYAGSPSARPREYDQIAALGGDRPHLNFPLRSVPEERFSVMRRPSGSSFSGMKLEELTLQQAVREAFPGAVFLHRAQGWRVYDWQNTAFERAIRVDPSGSPIYPTPIVRTFVNVGLGEHGVVARRMRRGTDGFLAECNLQINERVEGYVEGGVRKMYAELRESKPRMSPKTRDFRTTGVVVRIDEPWFKERGVRNQVADALRELIQRQYSIAPQDMESVATNIALVEGNRRQHDASSIVLFDTTHGSLRLTERAYLDFEQLLTQLERAVQMRCEDDDGLPTHLVAKLRRWFEHLDAGGGVVADDVREPGDGWMPVYRVGSTVARRDQKGVLVDIAITGHEMMEIDGRLDFFYCYQGRGGKAMVPAQKVEPVGSDWSLVYWNPATGEIRENVDENDD